MEVPLASASKCELRSVIRFLSAKKVTPIEIHRQLVEVYGEKCMDIKNVRKWSREFNSGRTDVHDAERRGRPSVSDAIVQAVEAEIDAEVQKEVNTWLREADGEWYSAGLDKFIVRMRKVLEKKWRLCRKVAKTLAFPTVYRFL
uniref:HTH_48 domain-containing protein n=1 Tax=Anopheles funestus TaxID=62324 RepID=A0A182S0D6_ANOFN